MVEMDKDLFSAQGVFFMIVFGIESAISMLGNGFILVVNGHSCLRSKKMPVCEFLLITLSLSRFLLQWVSMSSQFMYFSSPETYTLSKEQAFTCSWIYLNVASLSCATWLNVFYCVKVTNFSHRLFSWLKLRIGVLVPRCLGISLLAYVICSIHPVMRYFEDEKCHNLTGTLSENTSQSKARHRNFVIFLSTLQIYFTAISFSTCLTASIVLLLSLWRHIKNLKKGGFTTKDFSTQAHLSVMKPLLLSLFFFILHFVAMILALADILKFGKLERVISDIFLLSYPSAHSVILIITNPKLSKVCIHVLKLKKTGP